MNCLSCLGRCRAAYGPMGAAYQLDGVLIATDVSLKTDGSVGAAFVSLGERFPVRNVAVYGQPSTIRHGRPSTIRHGRPSTIAAAVYDPTPTDVHRPCTNGTMSIYRKSNDSDPRDSHTILFDLRGFHAIPLSSPGSAPCRRPHAAGVPPGGLWRGATRPNPE